MNEFAVCPHGPCAQAKKELQQRIEDLMRRVREERHDVSYVDLVQLLEPVQQVRPA